MLCEGCLCGFVDLCVPSYNTPTIRSGQVPVIMHIFVCCTIPIFQPSLEERAYKHTCKKIRDSHPNKTFQLGKQVWIVENNDTLITPLCSVRSIDTYAGRAEVTSKAAGCC